MNERIYELIRQSAVPADQAEDYALAKGLIEPTEKLDVVKFAELIVEECRTVVNELYRKTPLELCGPLITADEEIAKHFYGVEE